jgi:hypothetical protein
MSPLLIKISKDFATLFTTINPIATLALETDPSTKSEVREGG